MAYHIKRTSSPDTWEYLYENDTWGDDFSQRKIYSGENAEELVNAKTTSDGGLAVYEED